jgi:hypothetical protein
MNVANLTQTRLTPFQEGINTKEQLVVLIQAYTSIIEHKTS